MIKIKFKECCNTCTELDVYSSTTNAYANNSTVNSDTIIGCKHELVCGKYLGTNHDEVYGEYLGTDHEPYFKIGRVYEILQEDFLFMNIFGVRTKSYARGVLLEYHPGESNWGILRMLHNDTEIGVPLDTLRMV